MASDGFDYLIVGSTPLAGLVAGLLANAHRKQVCIVGEPFSPFRLQRSLTLSVAPVTRPETLILLQRAAAETVRLVNGWGKGLVTRVDPLFIAETPESVAALGYFRQLALALGYAVEPVADRGLAEGLILRVRDVQFLGHGRFEPALEEWLGQHGVRRLDRAEAAVSIRKDGTARITAGELAVEAVQSVLLDDEAILNHLPQDSRDRSLVEQPASALLLEGAKGLSAPYLAFLDRGVTLTQDGRAGVSALTSGDPATTRARLGSAAARAGALRIAGEMVFNTVATTDGAPYVGPARGGKAVVVAGLGPAAAFFAPAVARHLAGASMADEAAWFAARGATRGNLRLQAAEYAPVPA